MYFLFKMVIFHCYVSLPEGSICLFPSKKISPNSPPDPPASGPSGPSACTAARGPNTWKAWTWGFRRVLFRTLNVQGGLGGWDQCVMTPIYPKITHLGGGFIFFIFHP